MIFESKYIRALFLCSAWFIAQPLLAAASQEKTEEPSHPTYAVGYSFDNAGALGGALRVSRNLARDSNSDSKWQLIRLGLTWGVRGIRYDQDSASNQNNSTELSLYLKNPGLLFIPKEIKIPKTEMMLQGRQGIGLVTLPKGAARRKYNYVYLESGLSLGDRNVSELGIGVRANLISEPINVGIEKIDRQLQMYTYLNFELGL
jgi:hypothetical protein